MSVAVAEQQMVSVPDTSTLFMSRRDELRLVKRPIRQTRDAEGNVAETIPGETVAFQDGKLRVPPTGKARLTDGREIDAAELIAWLENHPLKDDLQEGFWRVDAPAPAASQDELDRLTELSMDLDAGGIETYIEQERDGWNREALLVVAEKALERVREKSVESDARREEALAQARAEGAAQAKAAK